MDDWDDRALLGEFAAWQQQRGLSPDNTITKYAELHRAWLRYLDTHGRRLATATRDDVIVFLGLRQLGPATRYSYLSRLATLHRWMLDEGIATTDPTARVPRPIVPKGFPRPIATGDLRVAFEAATPMLRSWLALSAYGGLRCREIAGLRVEDLILGDDPSLVVSAPKGNRQRSVPLHPTVLHVLRIYGLPRAGFVFLCDGVRYTAGRVSRLGNQFLREAGVPATMHQCRHWFATATYRATRDLLLVQHLLGHASPTTTAIYAAFDPAGGEVVRALSIG